MEPWAVLQGRRHPEPGALAGSLPTPRVKGEPWLRRGQVRTGKGRGTHRPKVLTHWALRWVGKAGGGRGRAEEGDGPADAAGTGRRGGWGTPLLRVLRCSPLLGAVGFRHSSPSGLSSCFKLGFPYFHKARLKTLGNARIRQGEGERGQERPPRSGLTERTGVTLRRQAGTTEHKAARR